MKSRLIILIILSITLFSFTKVNEQNFRKGKDYAIFFAINDYDEWQDLRYPISDATSISEELKNNYGFETEVIKNPTKAKIYETLDTYRKKSYDADAQLLVFFTGHGTFSETQEGFFIPREGKSDDIFQETYIAHTRLNRIINSIPCQHILLGLDACFSGTFDEAIALNKGDERPGVNKNERQKFIDRTLKYKSRLYATSGGKERTPDRSQFAQRFLAALRDFRGNQGIVDFYGLGASLISAKPQPKTGQFGEHEIGGNFLFILDNENKEKKVINTSNDQDADGIANDLDDCPTEYGDTRTNGCPDFDEDGIANKDDRCPYESGVLAFKGCPSPSDTDNDGIADNGDKCPNKYGPKRFQGCPDTDKDNIPDHQDSCPNEKGDFANNGCPKDIPARITERKYEYNTALEYSEEANRLKDKGASNEKIIACISDGRAKFPDDIPILLLEINHYLKLTDYEKTIELLNIVISLDPEEANYYQALGNIYDNMLNIANTEEAFKLYYEKALKNYTKAIDLNPKSFESNYGLGVIHYNMAAKLISKLSELDGDYSKAGIKKYDQLKREADSFFTKGLPYFKKAERLKPNDINTLLALKEIYARQNNLELSAVFKKRMERIQGGHRFTESYFK